MTKVSLDRFCLENLPLGLVVCVLKITKVYRGQQSAFKAFKKTFERDSFALFNLENTKIPLFFVTVLWAFLPSKQE